MSALKRSAAMQCTLKTLCGEGDVYFWTLTTPDYVDDVPELAKRWNHFLTILRREWKGPKKVHGVRVYEKHPGGHGLHIHFVVNCWLSVHLVRQWAAIAGFGRVHAVKWHEQGSDGGEALNRYLQKYLSKGRTAEFKGVRLYSTFGMRGIATRQCDIEVKSPFGTIWKAVAAVVIGFSLMPWATRVNAVTEAHSRWVCDEVEDPAAWCAINLVTVSTSQRPSFNAQRAKVLLECLVWDREMVRVDNVLRREKEFADWNNKQARNRVLQSREWA